MSWAISGSTSPSTQVSVFKASKFTGFPQAGTALPGAADAGPVTSDGVTGAYTIIAPTNEDYYILLALAGGNQWELAEYPGVQTPSSFGAGTFVAQSASQVPLKVVAAASQSADMVDVLASDGATVNFSVDFGGNPLVRNGNYYKARRSGGSAIINVIGFASGSDILSIGSGTTAAESIDFLNSGGAKQFIMGSTASAVNQITTTATATGSPPIIAATGSDTNIGLVISGKGNSGPQLVAGGAAPAAADNGFYVRNSGGWLRFSTNNAPMHFWTNDNGQASGNVGGQTLTLAGTTGTIANGVLITAGATTVAPSIQPSAGTGADTNTDLTIQGKGTGVINFGNATTTTTAPGAGAAGALPATPAGYITLKIGGTARQFAYY